MHEKLLQELKTRGAFCLWKYEECKGSRIKPEVCVAGYTSRFVTVTGDAICDTGIEERIGKQTIVIYWNFIGAVEIPVEAQEKTA